MTVQDLPRAATIHAAAFPRQEGSAAWLSCTLQAFPRTLCFVIEQEKDVIGYIVWAQKSGFRREVVLELEQIAIAPAQQNLGFGQHLIAGSLSRVRGYLSTAGSSLKHILVSTRADNHAQKIYRKVLGAEVEATLSNLFSADEVYMVARDPQGAATAWE